jgi:hypothetical protein
MGKAQALRISSCKFFHIKIKILSPGVAISESGCKMLRHVANAKRTF